MPNSKELEIAWAAGLFEGEGHFTRCNRRGVGLGVVSTDEDVVRRFGQAVNCGRFYVRYRKNKSYKTQYDWRIWKREDAQRVYTLFKPFLGKRRQQRWDDLVKEAAEGKPRLSPRNRPCASIASKSTAAGYQWHLRNAEPSCPSCLEAANRYQRDKYKRDKQILQQQTMFEELPDLNAVEARSAVESTGDARANGSEPHVCQGCAKPLTLGQVQVSTRSYGAPFCPTCQKQQAGRS